MQETQKTFTNINMKSPFLMVFVSPYFDKDFIVYSFASENTTASILTQNNSKRGELPISFMSKTLHNYELKYSTIENQAFSLVKVIYHFKTCSLSAHIITYVPHAPIKMLLKQQFREGNGTTG
jgi:hypothetical protein